MSADGKARIEILDESADVLAPVLASTIAYMNGRFAWNATADFSPPTDPIDEDGIITLFSGSTCPEENSSTLHEAVSEEKQPCGQ